MAAGNNGTGQLTVPPGFRFHPTDEELLYYYLRKKVSYEAIDLDVIREVDLNKLEPWDLKDKCRIGTSGHQNEWYFFSHKDKKYPTGTRTNRATAAGFWKATGRDKAIHMTNTSKTLGMRKTLVFYTGRAPHGQKTDWIMHEYRLNDDADDQVLVQEDGWVVCRVFTKKSLNIRSGFQSEIAHQEEGAEEQVHMKSYVPHHLNYHHHDHEDHPKQNHHHQAPPPYNFTTLDSSMHLPLLFSPESSTVVPPPSPFIISPFSLSTMDTTLCSQNLLSLTSSGGGGGGGGCGLIQHERLNNNGDWSFLDKLLASHQSMQDYHQLSQSKCQQHQPDSSQVVEVGSSAHDKFPFHYLGCETDILKYSK